MTQALAHSLIDLPRPSEFGPPDMASDEPFDLREALSAHPIANLLLNAPSDVAPPVARENVVHLINEVDRLRAEARSLRDRVRELENLADTDPLTPALNRRAFTREVERLASMADRYGLSPALVYVDLDAFKALNDVHGHAAGDAALRHVAQLLNAHVRESDVVGRLGGDEFAIALADGGEAAARAKAEQLTALLRATPAMADGVEVPVSASFGASAIQPGDSAAEALARADAAMYEVKRARA